MCAVGFSPGTPLANALAQAAPWGEIRRQPPRTDPEPPKNAVSAGVEDISTPSLHPLYQELANSARGPCDGAGVFPRRPTLDRASMPTALPGNGASPRPPALRFDRAGLTRASRPDSDQAGIPCAGAVHMDGLGPHGLVEELTGENLPSTEGAPPFIARPPPYRARWPDRTGGGSLRRGDAGRPASRTPIAGTIVYHAGPFRSSGHPGHVPGSPSRSSAGTGSPP